MKLALGTVQFGADYGITNRAGQVACDQVGEILAFAGDQGVDLLDTAALYGDSESVLGRAGAADRFRVVTKCALAEDPRALSASLMRSLDRLGCDTIYGFLLHRSDELLGSAGDRFYAALQDLKAQGGVEKVGASVYRPAEADALVQRYDLDLLQLPFSALDQRFSESGCLQRLADRGIEIHARSLFLQGVLLSDPADLPAAVKPHGVLLQRYHQQRQDQGIEALEFALGICHQHPEIDRYVIGCCSTLQLQQILAAYRAGEHKVISYQGIGCSDEALVIPSNW